MKSHDDYFNTVTHCLMTFQYIEGALKMVLIRIRVANIFLHKKIHTLQLETET